MFTVRNPGGESWASSSPSIVFSAFATAMHGMPVDWNACRPDLVGGATTPRTALVAMQAASGIDARRRWRAADNDGSRFTRAFAQSDAQWGLTMPISVGIAPQIFTALVTIVSVLAGTPVFAPGPVSFAPAVAIISGVASAVTFVGGAFIWGVAAAIVSVVAATVVFFDPAQQGGNTFRRPFFQRRRVF